MIQFNCIKNEYIEAGAGDDRVYGKDGADTANLGMGNDFFDGGKIKEFDNSQFFEIRLILAL